MSRNDPTVSKLQFQEHINEFPKSTIKPNRQNIPHPRAIHKSNEIESSKTFSFSTYP